MKKLICAILAMLMLMTCVSAFAAEPVVVRYDAFTSITYVLPEGYTTASTEHYGQFVAIDLVSEDKPEMILLVGSDEEYADLEKLNDLSEEDLQAYIDSLCEDWSSVETYVAETEYGTKFVIIDETSAEIDQIQIQGVYKGFTITLYMIAKDEADITEDDYNAGMAFMSEVWLPSIVE